MRRENTALFAGAGVFLAATAVLSSVPDAWHDAAFRRLPAALAAAYFQADLSGSSLALGSGRVIAVTRECGGGGFFALLCGVLTWHAVRRRVTGHLPFGLAAAWGYTMAVNAARVIVTVWARAFAETLLPERFFAAVHLVSGVLVFFPALIPLWLLCVRHGLSGERKERVDVLRETGSG